MSDDLLHIGLACSDLMTASRFDGDPSIKTVPARNAAAIARISEAPDPPRIWLVDLSEFAEDIPSIRTLVPNSYIIGFAPHVKVDLLEQGRSSCDKVLARGAVVRSFGTIVRKVAKL